MKTYRKKQVSIARKLSTNMVVFISIIGITFICINYINNKYESNALLLEKAQEYKRLISSSVEISLRDIDRDHIIEIGESYMQNQLICRLLIFDSMNRVIFSEQKKNQKAPVQLVWDIIHEQENIGRVELELSSLTFQQNNKAVFISGLQTLLLVVILILLTTGFFLNNVLKRPFQELNEIVKSYSSGNYQDSNTQTAYVEFKQFVSVLTEMAKKIIKQNERFEKRLLERTQSLDHANKELKRLALLAEEASIAKSEFLANITHELRTPMNAILGMASILSDLNLSQNQEHCINVVLSSANDLLALINNLLDFSNLDIGKIALDIFDFDLIRTVESILDLFTLKANAKNLELTHSMDSDVPTQLKGDPSRLQQVIANLLDNAIKFTDFGMIHLNVSLQKDHPTQPVLCFSVIDTGIGIHENDMKHLFKPFSQVDASLTRKYGGAGLGLIISKELVTLMGGDIHVKTKKEKGSTFWFTACFGSYKNLQ
jgi:signal transduction histidine kinase